MKFIDFKLRQLVGKKVLWTSGGEGKGKVKVITTIHSTLSEGFTIKAARDRIFNYRNGHQKAVTGRMMHCVSKCELITDEQEQQLTQEWEVMKEKISLTQNIIDNQRKLTRLDRCSLQRIVNELNQV